MYLSQPDRLLAELVRLARPGALLSILTVNPDAVAMRSGLQGRWRDTIDQLHGTAPVDGQYQLGEAHSLQAVSAFLTSAGAPVLGWHGVGIFTDHITEEIRVPNPAEIMLAEWLAGIRDPYRQIARCCHLVAQRG
ncbi:hypothetical protein [Parafrankia sp. EUN1f]|uniref:hypothetical protein n=1 Tax=Parafrankia sp. EUN1f TaxID=102897 RepID=UPI0001C44B03|nr:hypothetical protein [Parafrankia sp. EUN1f]EFC82943.1 hypothetical protein FrEUN1fDRAFT_3963 [Parafrankia sp. EUN1f]